MSFFSKIGKGIKKVVKKVGKYALPIAGAALPFIPGVGSAVSGAINTIGGWLGGGSSAANPPTPPPSGSGNPQVHITGQRPGFDWGQLLASGIPAIAGYFGQKATNASNAQQAQAQMDFQAEQTGTSYQRGVKDMQAAGLNPMLAYSQGGAASGGGAQATMGNEVQAGMSSAIQAMMTRQQLASAQAQVENIEADTLKKYQETDNLVTENMYTISRNEHEGSKIHETQQRVAEIALRNQLAALTQTANSRLASSSADLRRSEAEREQYLAKASKYDLSRASAWSDFFKSGAGKSYPYLSTTAEIANSAASAAHKLKPWSIK